MAFIFADGESMGRHLTFKSVGDDGGDEEATARKLELFFKVNSFYLRGLSMFSPTFSHGNFFTISMIAGLNPELCRSLRTDPSTNYALSPDVLCEAISNDIANGLIPFFLCAIVGTTLSTAINRCSLSMICML